MKTSIIILFLFFTSYLNAQNISDNMENYTPGEPITGGWWTDWCGPGPGCSLMSSSQQANSGSLSGYVPDDGTTNPILNLNNQVDGVWNLSFYMYVPSEKEGYFNLHGFTPPNNEWIVGNIFLNREGINPGVGLIDDCALGEVNFNFPHDQWFKIVMQFDLSQGMSNATWNMEVEGVIVIPPDTAFTDSVGTVPTSLGGLMFFSVTMGLTEYYVDDFNYEERILGVEENVNNTFEIYPNPVKTELNLVSKESIVVGKIKIISILGKNIFEIETSKQDIIDVTFLTSGLYFLEITFQNGTKSIHKFIKQ